MKYIADFHIHSKYAHGTSKFMDLRALSMWAQLKGINILGTGDFTHPLWQQELKSQLEEHEPGLFVLKKEFKLQASQKVYPSCAATGQRFLLSAEISTVFKRQGKCYRAHSIILAPSFAVVETITSRLAKVGNIVADGRPILGIDVQDLLKIVLEASPDAMLIPAHLWTPWYGLLGSKSGFNSIREAFGDLTDHIFAFETGLSSSFLMNAQVSELDRFTLLANSDAHSVQNLGREANIIELDELSYASIIATLKQGKEQSKHVVGIKFFPERGKYFADGHRVCGVMFSHEETLEAQKICPVCKNCLTLGVQFRVQQLADRSLDRARDVVKKSYSVLPLLDILEHELQQAPMSKKVQTLYHEMLALLGPEFHILLKADVQDIAQASTQSIARAIARVRSGDVTVQPGYDGVYGKVIF